MRTIDNNLWVVDAPPISFFGFPYALRTTVLRLRDRSLFVHSPGPWDEQLDAELATLGPVAWIVSPNKLHHLFLGQWATHYQAARVFLPPGLHERRPDDLRFDGVLSDRSEPMWADLDYVIVGPSLFMDEVVFFHRASRTVIFGDLIEDHDPARFTRLQRVVARANGMFGTTPVNYRMTFLRRSQTRARVRRIFDWRPRRVIMMHGPVVELDAEGYLHRGFRWLMGSSSS